VLYLRSRLNDVLAQRTGQSIAQIEKDTDRDNFMSADAAKTYGIVDDVLSTRVALSADAVRSAT
jgi:ATP-dependent Clp protease protease subunit